MDAKKQEAMRDVSDNIACYFTRGWQKWFAFIKIYPTEMDAKPVFDCLLGAFLFGELLRLDLFTVRNRMIFYGNFATLRCSTQIGTFNSNLLEHVAKLWLIFWRINRGKTRSVSNKHNICNIIAQYSYDISTLREISDGLSSNRQTGNFA